MKVTLLNSTAGAKDLLIFTKNTRLNMNASRLDSVSSMTEAEKDAELEYMVNTIKSSWEYVDFTFSIEGVSRAFTHQFVRNRMGSYAQQTMRILDVTGFEYVTGPSIEGFSEAEVVYHEAMADIELAYQKLIDIGVKIEDARGILPTNICTNIIAKFNLRTLSDMMASRASVRTQNEYRDVIEQMYQAVVAKEPWLEKFLRNGKFKACEQLESIILSEWDGTEECIDYLKLVDKVRNS